MKILPVTPLQLPYVWPKIMQYIQEAIEFEAGHLTPEKVYELCEDGTFVLIVVYEEEKIKAAQTIELVATPAGRIMNLVTTGGVDLDDWQDELCDMMEQLAKEQNCISIRTRGRLGWLRQLKRNGYEPKFFIAEKRV